MVSIDNGVREDSRMSSYPVIVLISSRPPAAKPSQFETGEDCETALTNVSPAVVLFYQIKMAT